MEAKHIFSNGLSSEKDLCEVLYGTLESLLGRIYGIEIDSVETEKVFNYISDGFFRFRVDFWVTSKCGTTFLIECKNPTHHVRENLSGVTQLMAYRMALEHAGIGVKYLLVTSVFSPFLLKFISDYQVPIDVLLLKNGEAGFWGHKTI